MASVTTGEVHEVLYNSCCLRVDMENLIMNLSNQFDRKPLEEDLEEEIENIWQQRTSTYPSLYNGTKFRLNNATVKDGCLVLNIGMTCYRDFICTNMRSDVRDRIRTWGSKHYGDPHACFADPVGVNGVVLSSDGQLVLLRRSRELYEYPGLVHTPGGHPEPSEIKNKNNENLSLNDMDPKEVAKEFYYSIQKEVRDEVNVPIESLSWPVLLGILRNGNSCGRPEICFLLRCSMSSKEIEAYYDKGGPEAFESCEILFLCVSDLKQSPTVSRLYDEMASSAKVTVQLYLQYLNSCNHK